MTIATLAHRVVEFENVKAQHQNGFTAFINAAVIEGRLKCSLQGQTVIVAQNSDTRSPACIAQWSDACNGTTDIRHTHESVRLVCTFSYIQEKVREGYILLEQKCMQTCLDSCSPIVVVMKGWQPLQIPISATLKSRKLSMSCVVNVQG